MSKRRKVFVTLTSLAIAVGLIIPLLRDTEPHYRDLSLSEWLALDRAYQFRNFPLPSIFKTTQFQESPDVEARGAEASEAIRSIGTNAIPWLIKWMSVPRNSWKTKLNKFVTKLPRAIRPSKLPTWLTETKDSYRASLAYRGFVVLGTSAATAIPDLEKLACDSRALGSANAVNLLAGLKPPAIPALINILTNCASKDVKVRVMQCLGYLGAAASPAVPPLIAYLKSSDEALATFSAVTLARIRQQPERAIPALIAALEDPRSPVRMAAAKALGQFGGEAGKATVGLRELLAKPDIALAREAERALLKINPPTLVEEFLPHFDDSSAHPVWLP